MITKMTSNDLSMIQQLYVAMPKDGVGTLEVVVKSGEHITNPTWKEVKSAYEKHSQVTLSYSVHSVQNDYVF